jgi:hypothetical protein
MILELFRTFYSAVFITNIKGVKYIHLLANHSIINNIAADARLAIVESA